MPKLISSFFNDFRLVIRLFVLKCFSKNDAKIANSLPNFQKLTKKSKKACFWQAFFTFNAISFLV